MTDVQGVGHVRFEAGRYIIELDGDVLEEAHLKAGAAVFVRIESIEVTA